MCLKKVGILKELEIQKVKKFKEFYERAKKVRGRHFSTFTSVASTQIERPNLCFAVVASKKGVDKRAVNRNRAKRRLRAAFHLALKQNPEIPCKLEFQSATMVLTANRSAVSCNWAELYNDVSSGVTRFLNRDYGK